MVIRGKTRGNGKQLAHYLAVQAQQENEHVRILEVNGRLHANDDYFHQTMLGMSLTSELSKGMKGLYHAQINPAYVEDKSMNDDQWMEAADILGQELGLENQRRVIVLHQKKGRTHAHVVWERYDHQHGKLISDSFSRLAQDRARKEMEHVFEHKQTPHRNAKRPELKTALTSFWEQTETGEDFIKTVSDNGYMIAAGVPDRPFMVVDENGRTYDLVRQLKGIRTKDVRARLRDEKLTPEKEAIEIMRNRNKHSKGSGKSDQQKATTRPGAKQMASAFADNRNNALNNSKGLTDPENNRRNSHDSEPDFSQEKKKDLAGKFEGNRPDLVQSPETGNDTGHSDQDAKQKIARAFADNRDVSGEALSEEEEIQKLIDEQKAALERRKQKRKMRMR